MNNNGGVFTASIVSYLLKEIQSLPSGLVYGLVALLVFGEAALFIGFVLPGETSVIIAGVVASQGHVNIVLLCLLVVFVRDRRRFGRLRRRAPLRRAPPHSSRSFESAATTSIARSTAFAGAVRSTCSSDGSPRSCAR